MSKHNPSSFPWWRRHPRLTVVLLAVVLAAAGGVAYATRPQPVAPVYLTDGSHVFNPGLAQVEDLIHRENDRVAATGQPYVSVAFLATMDPVPDVDANDLNSMKHELQGAYLAQFTANHPSGKPQPPLVRLLLVDAGSREANWRDSVRAIQGAITGSDHLVAVTGLGISISNTTNLVRTLAARHVAMVGATLTADSFDGVPGMVRVAPTNSQEAVASVQYLNRDQKVPSGANVLLVQDQNASDTYAKSLGTAFTRALHETNAKALHLVSPTMVYDSTYPDAPTILGANAQRVCGTNARVVYFAGRGNDLQGFLAGLAARSCTGTPLTVVSGDDASQLAGRQLWLGNGANLTAVFTTLANPDVWQHQPAAVSGATVARFGECSTCYRGLFPNDSLDDGVAIMAHDAVLTAVVAARQVVAYVSPNVPRLPSTGAVAQALYQVSVPGASGYLCFDAAHSPVDKAIPIMSADQHGRLSYLALSSASGNPPSGGCTT
jgi:hypothetical protein